MVYVIMQMQRSNKHEGVFLRDKILPIDNTIPAVSEKYLITLMTNSGNRFLKTGVVIFP